MAHTNDCYRLHVALILETRFLGRADSCIINICLGI